MRTAPRTSTDEVRERLQSRGIDLDASIQGLLQDVRDGGRCFDRIAHDVYVFHKLPLLTPRQKVFLALTAQGIQDALIAEVMGISIHTVRAHCRDAVSRMGAHNRTHAVAEAIRKGLI